MTETDKRAMVRAITGETDDEVIAAYLALAGNKVCRRAYPFGPETDAVPDRYSYIQVEIAVYLMNKRGAEGETAHSENGVSRTYGDGDVPPALLRDILPLAAPVGQLPEDPEDPEGTA